MKGLLKMSFTVRVLLKANLHLLPSCAFKHKSKINIFTVDTSNRQSSTQSLQALDLTAAFAIHLEKSVSVGENVATKQLK